MMIEVTDWELSRGNQNASRWSTFQICPFRICAVTGMVVTLMAGALIGSASADPRVVVELFTSQGCSSCPPADKLLGEFANDPAIIALTMPIDYWDYLGWKDTLADPSFTARQKAYSHARGDREVYTPQVVVNGAVHVLGSDRTGIERAAARTSTDSGIMSVPISVTQTDTLLSVSVSNGDTAHGEVWVCAISKSVPVRIGRGENRGREVIYHNVVRRRLKVGDWSGKAENWTVPLEHIKGDGIDAAVVYVQHGSRDTLGPMLGATYMPLQ